MQTVALRFANVYGPRQDPHGEAGVVAIFCNRILTGQAMTVFGDGSQTRDYVFVKDVARANVAAATRPLPPAGRLDARGFNVGTGIETSVVELAEQLQAAAGRRVGIVNAPARPGEQQRSAVRIDRARELLGWTPRTSLADGLAETYAWFAARRDADAAVAGGTAR
jgi:UDP-glucose 4-epimerase